MATFGAVNTFEIALTADLPVIAYHDAPELLVATCGDRTYGGG